VDGCQNPRKDGAAKKVGMALALTSAASCRRTLGGKRWLGGNPCQGRQPPEGGAAPKHFLFFTQTSNGQTAAKFLQRLKERTKDLDAPVSNEAVQAQLAAIQAWGQGDATTLGRVQHPVLVVNGDDDVMVPSFNSFELARRLPKAQIFPDAGHGGIFQHHGAFVQQALAFLQP
jgi:pimeloyl-ACP methyl ester carboxylesterase